MISWWLNLQFSRAREKLMDIHTPATPDISNNGSAAIGPAAVAERPIFPPSASYLVILGECLVLVHSLVTVIHVLNKPSKWTQIFGNLLTSEALKIRTQAANNMSPLTTATQPGGLHTLPARPPARQRLQARSHIVHTCYICFIYQHINMQCCSRHEDQDVA